jgi:2,4-dienoyl-CoA reductase-like NADH-dependent reductase (Old Yellow Enzyme family)
MAKLFTPIQVGDIQLRHRVVQAPMTRLRVDAGTNIILPTVKEYYEQRASTPGTLIISEGMKTSLSLPNCMILNRFPTRYRGRKEGWGVRTPCCRLL